MQTGDERGNKLAGTCRLGIAQKVVPAEQVVRAISSLTGLAGGDDVPRSSPRHTRCGRRWFNIGMVVIAGRWRVPLCKGGFTMSDFRFFGTHRTWEDWLGMLLGVLIV